jgi:hypothetical protein
LTKSASEFYREELDRCWPLLKKSLDSYGPTHTKDHLWQLIEAGQAQFWPMKTSAMMTLIDAHPTGFVEGRAWLAAGNLEEILHWEPLMSKWAKDTGCHRVSVVGRRGWGKVLPEHGYRELVTTFAKDF